MMPTLTRRSIRRAANARFQGVPKLAGMMDFMNTKEVEYGLYGRARGSRVFIGQVGNGEFLSATFAHPTKKITKGRLATISWRKPSVPV